MENQEKKDEKLSKFATWWFYIALVLALPFYISFIYFSYHKLLFSRHELLGERFFLLSFMLAGAIGLISVVLIFRRKLCGAYGSVVSAVLLCASGFVYRIDRAGDIILMVLLTVVPAALLFSQIPTLKKLKKAGPGWGLGDMAHTTVAVRWFRIALTLSSICYLFLFIIHLAATIIEPYHPKYSFYMASIAGAIGSYAILLALRKKIFMVFWSIIPCIFLGLGLIDIGFGQPHKDVAHPTLLLGILAAIMLLSQVPYLRKTQKMSDNAFQKTHFANGASLRDEDLADLYTAWSSWALVAFYIPGMALALVGSNILYRCIGGVVGNFSGVALIFAALFSILTIRIKRKKRYIVCRDRLGLTEEDTRQALLHKKWGTSAWER
jgi:hypothetical protein